MNEFLIELHELLARYKASISFDVDEYNPMGNSAQAVTTVGDEEFNIPGTDWVLDAYDLKRYLDTVQQ